MNERVDMTKQPATTALGKSDPTAPALVLLEPTVLAIRAGTAFGGRTFTDATPVVFDMALEPGCDYGVVVVDGDVGYAKLTKAPAEAAILGGFHVAPGGNAAARTGGDTTPAINPCSLWDLNFRPACSDPRGMTLVDDAATGRFWCDIYLTGKDHLLNGTSRFGVTIADGDDAPQDPAGGYFDCLDHATAAAVMKCHGKGLLSVYEFFAAAYGTTEKSACGDEPETTQLDAPRTSKWGVIQATGNMWVWGHDGDPDSPRPSFFGGSWLHGSGAGSRCARLGCWPEYSDGSLGARGRSDHLQLG